MRTLILFFLIVFWWAVIALFFLLTDANAIPVKSLTEWHQTLPLKTRVIKRPLRCRNKKSARLKFKCYRRAMIKKFGNDIRTFVYFAEPGAENLYYTADYCLGVQPCFGFGNPNRRTVEVVTDLAAWGIEIGETRPDLVKLIQYEDAWEFSRWAKNWCSKKFKGRTRKDCIKGYWKIKDPNAEKFKGRPRWREF